MIKIHTNYSWYTSSSGLILILVALILFTKRFALHQKELDRITENLRTAEIRLEEAISVAQIGVFDVDAISGKSKVNSTWKSLMGFTLDANIDPQLEWLKRVHPEDLQKVQQEDADCLAGKKPRSEMEYRILSADGSWRWMKSQAIAYKDPGGNSEKRLLGVQYDITERKESDILKSEFISTVSHELRTPVTSIHASLRLVLSEYLSELPKDATDLLKISERNSHRLIGLINDILDVEKLTNQGGIQYELEELCIGQCTRLAVSSVRPLCDAASIRIEFEDLSNGSTSMLDSARFEQVLVNLLSNAIKFSPVSGMVRVKVQSDRATTCVSVTDQGPGISKEFFDKVFERFRTADPTNSRHKQGAGLGLHISKRIVEEMGGQIYFQSEPHVATTFSVSFPKQLMTESKVSSNAAA